jgi:hypothetical protein
VELKYTQVDLASSAEVGSVYVRKNKKSKKSKEPPKKLKAFFCVSFFADS